MDCFRTLYIDMDSFYASVEQQLDPNLRGRPVAVTAVDHEAGAVVAASYDAKALGIGVGTRIYEAKRICPGITFVGARHKVYVRFNQRIARAIDEVAELERVRSVDEFQIGLSEVDWPLDRAKAMALRIKAAVRDAVGPHITCSIGLGPNHLLAKIAGKLQKPDGLSWLSPANMPDALAHWPLEKLPGIAGRTERKLMRAGITSIPALYRMDPRHARAVWGSVQGERFVRALQGADIPLTPYDRHGYGNSKVLAPEYRSLKNAYLVSRWLVEKSTARLRRDGYVAGVFSVQMALMPRGWWSQGIKTWPSQDTQHFQRLHRALWRQMYREARFTGFLSVGVHLGSIKPLESRMADLFIDQPMGKPTDKEKLGTVIDRINRRYGVDTVSYGLTKPHYGFFEKG